MNVNERASALLLLPATCASLHCTALHCTLLLNPPNTSGRGTPQLLASLAAEPLAGLVDAAYVGRLGPTQLAGVGVALSIFNSSTKLLNVPLLAVTTSAVAAASGRATAAAAAAASDSNGSSSGSGSSSSIKDGGAAGGDLAAAASASVLVATGVGALQVRGMWC